MDSAMVMLLTCVPSLQVTPILTYLSEYYPQAACMTGHALLEQHLLPSYGVTLSRLAYVSFPYQPFSVIGVDVSSCHCSE